jgi:hypothetical protein
MKAWRFIINANSSQLNCDVTFASDIDDNIPATCTETTALCRRTHKRAQSPREIPFIHSGKCCINFKATSLQHVSLVSRRVFSVHIVAMQPCWVAISHSNRRQSPFAICIVPPSTVSGFVLVYPRFRTYVDTKNRRLKHKKIPYLHRIQLCLFQMTNEVRLWVIQHTARQTYC